MNIEYRIISSGRFHRTRMRDLWDLWGRRVVADGGTLSVFTDSAEGCFRGPTEWRIATPDSSYESAIDKTLAAARFTPGSADWVMICDDDTVVFPAALRQLAGGLDPSRAEVHGCAGRVIHRGRKISVAHGGAGILLSRAAAERVCLWIAAGKPVPRHERNSDVTLAYLLADAGIPVVHADGRFRAAPGAKWPVHARQVSLHKLAPGEIERLREELGEIA